jgi:hypothetical protein
VKRRMGVFAGLSTTRSPYTLPPDFRLRSGVRGLSSTAVATKRREKKDQYLRSQRKGGLGEAENRGGRRESRRYPSALSALFITHFCMASSTIPTLRPLEPATSGEK